MKTATNLKIKVRPAAKFCIEMWRVVSILMELKPTCMAVPMLVIARNEPNFPDQLRACDWELIKDASPTMVCAALRDPSTKKVGKWSNLTLPFDSAAHQNMREYLGLLFGLILANHVAGPITQWGVKKQKSMKWVGDNTVALAWADASKVKSKSGQFANITVTWCEIYGNISVDATEHLAGELMGDIDGATRQKHSPR